MCGVCRGQHVVTSRWIEASLRAGCWQDEEAFRDFKDTVFTFLRIISRFFEKCMV